MNKPALILTSLLIAAFAINLDTTIVNVALPTLVRELHASNSELQWIVDAYNLVFAALILSFGSLSDRVGRKGMLISGLGVFGLASFAGALTDSAGGLIAARCCMGLGAAMVFPSTLSIISNVFTERADRARAIGLWGATAGVAIALGPIFGGWLLGSFSWSSIFFAMAPVAALGALLVALYVPTSRDPEAPPLDWVGFLLSTAAMALLVYTIIEAPIHGWGSLRSVGGFVGSAALLVAFVVAQRRSRTPMLDVRLFRNPRFSAASAAVTVSFFTLLGFIFVMTQYFQFIKRYDPLSAGVHLLPVAVCVGAASVFGTKLAMRFGTKLIVSTGLLMVTGFYAWVATVISPSTPYATIAAQMVLYGTGMGLTSAPATEAIMGAVSLTKAGVGSAVNDATRLLGGTLGVAVIGSVYASIYSNHLTSVIPAGIPRSVNTLAHSSLGAALTVAERAGATGHAGLGAAIHNAALDSFIKGVSGGCLVAAVVAGIGALAAAMLLPAQPLSQNHIQTDSARDDQVRREDEHAVELSSSEYV